MYRKCVDMTEETDLAKKYPIAKAGLDYCAKASKGYLCTRSKGHKGNHVAHGPSTHAYAEWDSNPEKL